MKPILLVDDDPELAALLCDYLGGEGFAPCVALSGAEALSLLAQHTFEAVVLDIMMPRMSGLEVLQAVRARSGIPVLMLTGRGDDIDRIVGLELGADDYLAKPCNPRELAARLRAVLRRTAPAAEPPNALPSMHGIVLNSATLVAHAKGCPLTLTAAEFSVLKQLLLTAGQVNTKEALTREALNRDYTAYDRAIDVHVSRIRHKLMAAGVAGDVIRSLRGVGYQLLLETH